ncbi:MAG: ABC transporter ATP-binding protein [Spirochaetaceae bacterium]|nr:ABC transporter ATP-binding protein [Myxococcales bacterium]MCB9724482.1 ABC transporter ATP-binding protein [Spirochaetaceae bacterium]HPG26428.1 ABC transporter ATP-binding protein [Myxococcota bacterium]
MSALLEVRDLRTVFPGEGGPTPVVDGVSFDLDRGEVLALVGESGSGKSMTAFSILRLVPKPGRVVAGSVRLGGEDLLGLSVTAMRRVRGRRISMIFQEPMTCLNPVVRVGEQVVEAIRLHEDVSRADARDRTRALFAEVGIPDPEARLDAYPHQLSGGLKQRVMIAMALSTRPEMLIADEPTTALDVTVQAQILTLLRELQQSRGTAILLITHDLGIVNELADRVAVMYAGRLVEIAPRVPLLTEPLHPYTQGLLRSMPARGRPGEPLPEIPGVVPRASEWPRGCRFSTRCPVRFEPCAETYPAESHPAAGRRVFCHDVERRLPSEGAR